MGPMFEPLESRRMLSGNVSAVIVSGVLVVTGDNKANQVEVSTTENFTTEVRPLGDTRVNGSTAPAVFDEWPDIAINVGNGEDFVRLRDLTTENVSVSTGNGN